MCTVGPLPGLSQCATCSPTFLTAPCPRRPRSPPPSVDAPPCGEAIYFFLYNGKGRKPVRTPSPLQELCCSRSSDPHRGFSCLAHPGLRGAVSPNPGGQSTSPEAGVQSKAPTFHSHGPPRDGEPESPAGCSHGREQAPPTFPPHCPGGPRPHRAVRTTTPQQPGDEGGRGTGSWLEPLGSRGQRSDWA